LPNTDPDNPFEKDKNEIPADEIPEDETTLEEQLTTSLRCVKGEASRLVLWENPPILPHFQSTDVDNEGQVPSTISSTTAVEAISAQMVTNILQEVTRKSSMDSNVGNSEVHHQNPDAEMQVSKFKFLLSFSEEQKLGL